MSVEDHRRGAPGGLGFAAVTVSDTRTAATDAGGRRIRELVEAAGHRLVAAEIVPDEVAALRAAVAALLGRDGVDAVVLTGGTGLSPRDVTPEAVEPLLERPLPGFGELFRALSRREVGAAAMLSRAFAGVARGRVVYALPGSPAAVELAMTELILPETGHLLAQCRRRV
jgi:molybdenum cofactor biosynthesis protein B